MIRTIRESLQEYARGVAGGLIFSLPLLFTFEVWWAGEVMHPGRLLGAVAVTFALLLGYNFFAGIRRDATILETVIDSVEELGLGIVLSAASLWILNRIQPEMSAGEIVGKIVIEACLVAIGVSVGTAQLGTPSDDQETGESSDPEADEDGQSPGSKGLLAQIVIAACGAFLFAANVAPTEEIEVLAAHMAPLRLLALALISLAIGAVVLYGSNFRGAGLVPRSEGKFAVVAGIFLSYAIALASSAGVLWFFGRFDGASLEYAVAQTVVLGFAAALGASAGRLLLQVDQ